MFIHSRLFKVSELRLLSSTVPEPTETPGDHLSQKPPFLTLLQIRCASCVLYDSLESEREFNMIPCIEVTARGGVTLVSHLVGVWFSPAFIDCDVRGRSRGTDEEKERITCR